jgi:hypothetical protein
MTSAEIKPSLKMRYINEWSKAKAVGKFPEGDGGDKDLVGYHGN